MQTYSHILITAALSIPLKNKLASKTQSLPPLNKKALIFGSLLPDLALILIAVVCILRDWLSGAFSSQVWQSHQSGNPATNELTNLSWTASLFDDWFFNNPIVITLQNTFHSPVVLITIIAISYYCYTHLNKPDTKWSIYVFWVASAALLHTLIDIPLHSTDGPLIFFPLDWDYRFASPISYWDSNYHGEKWTIFEHSLDLILIIFLIWRWRNARSETNA